MGLGRGLPLGQCHGIGEGAAPGTVPGRAALGSAEKLLQKKSGIAKRQQSSNPSKFETLPATSNGNLADMWLSAHPARISFPQE